MPLLFVDNISNNGDSYFDLGDDFIYGREPDPFE